MAGQFHAAAQRVVAHYNFAAQHHQQIAAVVGGRVQDLVGRDPACRAIPAQAGPLTAEYPDDHLSERCQVGAAPAYAR